MKLVKLSSLLAICAALSLTGFGCRKGLDKTTHIPKGANPTVAGDVPSGPTDVGPGTPPGPTTGVDNTGVGSTGLPKSSEGIAAAKGDFTNWIENRDEFKAQTVYFDFDKSNVKPGEVAKLEEVARRMKSSFQGKALRVEGHCDERGTEEYNRSLGDRRANTIREKLVELGLSADLIPTISFGEDKPAETGHDDAAWKKNRRGELILLSPPGAGN